MSQERNLMTTGEFAKTTGIPSAKISKLIRAGKIIATKVSGRWQIDRSQLEADAVQQYGQTTPGRPAAAADGTVPAASKSPAASSPKAFSIAEFASMTYLTEKGVQEWLKSGRLKGQQGSDGKWSVDAANLQAAGMSRLVRK